MNQKQREILTGIIGNNVRARIEDLKKKLMKEPSLNNHLIHAVLSGEIVYQSPEHLAEFVKQAVLSLSSEERLISIRDAFNSYSNLRHKYKGSVVLLPPEAIFVLPKEYLDSLAEVKAYNEKIYQAIDALRAYGEKLNLKIQIGSSESLEKLVDEADNLADISLMKNVIGELPQLSEKNQGLLGKGDEMDF